MMVVTHQMIRDMIGQKGQVGVTIEDLLFALASRGVKGVTPNYVMGFVTDLMVRGDVWYDYNTGTYVGPEGLL